MLRQLQVPTGAEKGGRFQTEWRYCGTASATRVTLCVNPDVCSANLVEVAAGLPRKSDRWDMGYQWISRFLANGLVCCDDVMAPFAREILAWLAESGEPIPLILDQTKASDHHQF